MICMHRMLPNVDKQSIDEAVERVGYEGYVPYELIRHLTSAYMHYRIDGLPERCIVERTPYTEGFYQLLAYIHFDRVHDMNPVDCAAYLLKLSHKHIDLRKFEKAAKTGQDTTVSWHGEKHHQNYSFDVTIVPEVVLELLDIELDEDPNHTVLDKDVQKVLSFYEGITKNPGTAVVREVRKYRPIRTFNEVTRVKKYKYQLPTFEADLALKKLHASSREKIHEDKSEVVIALDCNLISKRDDLEFLAQAVLLYYIGKYDGEKIIYHEFARYILKTVEITDKASLIALYHSYKRRHLGLSNITNATNQLGVLYSNKDIIVITPGDIQFELKRNHSNRFYGVSLKDNKSLKELCIKSGGTYTEV